MKCSLPRVALSFLLLGSAAVAQVTWDVAMTGARFVNYDGTTTVSSGPGRASLSTGEVTDPSFSFTTLDFQAGVLASPVNNGGIFSAGTVLFHNGMNLLGTAATVFTLQLDLRIDRYDAASGLRTLQASSTSGLDIKFTYVSTPNTSDLQASADSFVARNDISRFYHAGLVKENEQQTFGIQLTLTAPSVPSPLPAPFLTFAAPVAAVLPVQVDFSSLIPLSAGAEVVVATDPNLTNVVQRLTFSSVPEPSTYGFIGGTTLLAWVSMLRVRRRSRGVAA